jgi:hypothetical protein
VRGSVTKSMTRITESLDKYPNGMEGAINAVLVFHDDAFRELRRALWNPLALRFRRQRLRNLQQRASHFEKPIANLRHCSGRWNPFTSKYSPAEILPRRLKTLPLTMRRPSRSKSKACAQI